MLLIALAKGEGLDDMNRLSGPPLFEGIMINGHFSIVNNFSRMCKC